METLLAFYVGTSGTKAVLVTPSGQVLATAFEPYPTSYPLPLWAEQDPRDWWRAVTVTARQVLEAAKTQASRVSGLAFTTQMVNLIPLDPAGIPLRPAISWLDGRAGHEARSIMRRVGGAMMSIGEQGYLQAAQRILETTAQLRTEVAGFAGLKLIGLSLFIVAFPSDEVDIYAVLDAMSKKQWNLNGLQNPASVHLCVTQRHVRPGVAEAFVEDLQEAVGYVRRNPQEKGTMGVVYGLAASLPVKSLVADFLKTYIDLMYQAD